MLPSVNSPSEAWPDRSGRWLRGAAALIGLVASSGCTLLAGQPWGEADIDLQVMFDVDASRLDDDGRLKTAQDYGLELTRLEVGLTTLRLLSTSAEASSTSAGGTFDPSSPPPGYSLCHNGHCHADDGSLVDYEDIEAELAGGGASSGPVTVAGRTVLSTPLSIWPEVDPVELEGCANGCLLDRVSLSAATLGVTDVRFAARVVDLRPESTARLPADGVLVEGEIDAASLLEANLAERFDRDQPIGMRLLATAVFAPTLFDGMAFGELVGADPATDAAYDLSSLLSVQTSVQESLGEDSGLLADVERYEPELADNTLAILPAPLEGG